MISAQSRLMSIIRIRRRIKMDQSLNMVKIAYDALDDKLAEDIKIIDIRSISSFSRLFYYCRW